MFFCFACRCPLDIKRKKTKIFRSCVIVAYFGATFWAFRGIGEREDFLKNISDKPTSIKTVNYTIT